MKVSKSIKSVSYPILGLVMVTAIGIGFMYFMQYFFLIPFAIYTILLFSIILYTEYHKDFHIPEWLGLIVTVSAVLWVVQIIFIFFPNIGTVEFIILLGFILYILNSYFSGRRLS
jgi:hypothetical protein